MSPYPTSNKFNSNHKRVSFNVAQKAWWIEAFTLSKFESRPQFLKHVKKHQDLKTGYYYKLLKNNDTPPPSTLNNWFKAQIKIGIMNNNKSTRMKQRQPTFPQLEKHLLNYITSSEENLSTFGIGISWHILISKAKDIASGLVKVGTMTQPQLDTFQFSNGWIQKFCKCHNISMHKLVGEVNTLSQKKLKEGLENFHNRIHQLIRKHNVSTSCIFNADQAGLYYRCFPCTTICAQHRKKEIKGTKGMKDKDCITFMLCASATGSKVPLAFVGKSKNPRCFKKKHMLGIIHIIQKPGSTLVSQSGGFVQHSVLSAIQIIVIITVTMMIVVMMRIISHMQL